MKALRVISIVTVVSLLVGCSGPTINLNLGGGGEKKKDTKRKETPPPSQLPAGGGSWGDIAAEAVGKVFLDAEHGVVFYAFDTLAYPGKPVQLVGRVQSARNLKGIEDVTIGFYSDKSLIGQGRTDGNGYAAVEWTPPTAGDHRFSARIVEVPGEDYEELLLVRPVPLLVAARDKDTQFVIIDLDHTLVESGFFRVLTFGATPMPNSQEVTRRIAKRYSIIYLTHRPDLLTRKSKAWLTRHEYPPGPLLVSQLKDAFADSGKFKTAKLTALRKSFPNVRIGIGDKISDAQGYVDNSLTAYLIPHYKDKPKDMRKRAREIERLRGRGRCNVVGNWEQIEAGIFLGTKFPAKPFAQALRRRADYLEGQENARKEREKEKDDDDD